jgi:hypothetical protein
MANQAFEMSPGYTCHQERSSHFPNSQNLENSAVEAIGVLPFGVNENRENHSMGSSALTSQDMKSVLSRQFCAATA